MLLKESIKLNRLLLCFLITFVLVDTCPYPNWSPGFIQSFLYRIQQIVMEK